MTSWKCRPSISASSGGSKRWMWKGFSKSAGALGVRKKTVPSSASTRDSSLTWPSGSSKCSMRCEEQAQAKLPRAKPEGEGVHLGHLQAVTAPPVLGHRHCVGAVVGPDHGPVLGQEAGRLEPLAAAHVEHGPRAQPLDHRAVAGGVQGEQRIGGHALHGPFAGEPPARPRATDRVDHRPAPRVRSVLAHLGSRGRGRPVTRTCGSESFAGRRLFTLPITRVGSPTFHRRAPRPVLGPVARPPTPLTQPPAGRRRLLGPGRAGPASPCCGPAPAW